MNISRVALYTPKGPTSTDPRTLGFWGRSTLRTHPAPAVATRQMAQLALHCCASYLDLAAGDAPRREVSGLLWRTTGQACLAPGVGQAAVRRPSTTANLTFHRGRCSLFVIKPGKVEFQIPIWLLFPKVCGEKEEWHTMGTPGHEVRAATSGQTCQVTELSGPTPRLGGGCSKHGGGHTVKARLGAHVAGPQLCIYSGTLAGPLTLVPMKQMTPSPHSPSEFHDID